MKRTKRIFAGTLALLMALLLLAHAPTNVRADGEHDTIALVDGFFCLHPHKETPTPYDNMGYTSVSSKDYTGYSQDTLDQVAAVIILSLDFQDFYGQSVSRDDQQAVIWRIVCDDPVHISKDSHLQSNDPIERARLRAYYTYVLEHYQEVVGKYLMTIWVADNQSYQDILEAKRIEKHEVPSVEKKVLDRNDTNNAGDAAVGWQDSADHDIGDSVPFQITATLRDMTGFQEYFVEFVDNMTHLTFQPSTLRITIDGQPKTDQFTVTWDKDTKELRIKCEDVLKLGATTNSQIVVYYEATLDSDAVIGHEGNPNLVYLIYSRSTGSADRGITPKDKVTVFTYQVTFNKVDQAGNALPGAAFELFKQTGENEWTSLGALGATLVNGSYVLDEDAGTTFLWTGIDDGTYKLVEIVTPVGYNTMEPLVFTVIVDHEHLSEDPKIVWAHVETPGLTEFHGFDATNTYYDSEIGGLFASDIENRAGSILPSTGGIGTTLFYVLGAVLAVGAGVLLITRKRMDAADETK